MLSPSISRLLVLVIVLSSCLLVTQSSRLSALRAATLPDKSSDSPPPPPPVTIITLYDGQPMTVKVAQGTYQYFQYSLLGSSTNRLLTFNLTAQTADADLYVSTVVTLPNSTNYQWSSTNCCGQDDLITIKPAPHNSTRFFVAVYGYEGDGQYNIEANSVSRAN